jgi:hypothetical protein
MEEKGAGAEKAHRGVGGLKVKKTLHFAEENNEGLCYSAVLFL